MTLAIFFTLYGISVAIAAPLLNRYVPPEERDEDHWFEVLIGALTWPAVLLNVYLDSRRSGKKEK